MPNHPNRSWRNRWENDPAGFCREYRKRHNLTQKRLAELLNIHVRRIENLEQGEVSPDALLPRALRDLERELKRVEKGEL